MASPSLRLLGPVTHSPTLQHDHRRCVDTALQNAELVCQHQSARLTPIRRRVLELIWASHRPIGAYELLEQLAQEGHKPAPPTIYRALEFLLEQGLVHRITSLNAYLGCSHPGKQHGGFFLICSACAAVEEVCAVSRIQEAITQMVQQASFALSHSNLEIVGLCKGCRHD